MTNNAGKVLHEISRMHSAIEAWVRGLTPEDMFATEISDYLSPDFRIAEPNGQVVTRDDAMRGLFGFRGGNPDFRIVIDEAEIIYANDDVVLAAYVERQTGAKLATSTNARRSTCLFSVSDVVRHLYLHETWIEGAYT